MNIEEYISSGILEAYALGDLTTDERIEVEKNLARYPQLQAELARIEKAQEELLLSQALQPRASVKEQLFKKLDNKKTADQRVIAITATVPFWRYAAAACLVIAFGTSYLAYVYYTNWQTSEDSLASLIAQNQQIAQNYNTVNQRLVDIETDLNIIRNPAFNRIVLKGTANAQDALASVYWNPSTQEVYLSIQNLKTLANDYQYQLWAIVDGKPVDAGVFDQLTGNLQKMKLISGAAAFAITIEPRGGKSSPTLETMQVIGNFVEG